MKTTKNTKNTKKIKKLPTPVFVVDITDCETEVDVIVSFVVAKVNAGVAITRGELETVIANEVELALDEYMEDEEETQEAIDALLEALLINNTHEEKPNAIKRFWNWVTRK